MNSFKKTLVILTPGFAASEADTTCLPFLQSHVKALRDTNPGLDIIILAFQYPYMKGAYKWNNVDVISFDGRERGKWQRLRIWMQVWRTLKALGKKKNIIGLFSLWCTECALIGSYFGKVTGIKHYNWLCGQDAKTGNKYVKLIKPKAGELIAMSDFLQRQFYKNYKIKPEHVIPIGIEQQPAINAHSSRDIDILGVGSLIPLKQYDVFINVVNELRNNFPDINTRICGNGPDREKLDNLITGLDLQDNCSLAGEVPHHEVISLMQQVKIFLHTSNYEGFGTVCLEALCAGAHVISFTRPMDGAIAHWHHVSNVREMVAKVREILPDSQRSHTPVVPFTTTSIAMKIMELYAI